jgi:NADPH-dependent 2,4-dienoyl-CoA reductase/sulfur reductase-like enzyme
MEGRESEIRPCVGMGYCIDRIYFGGEALCAHNAATGREATMPHVIALSAGRKRKVVVVGAGPAGLEAARVAAARGHAVVVFEAAAEPGGQLRLAAKLARRREILGISDWRVDQCEKHGVQFRLNTLAEAEDVLAEQPGVVFIATGGVPNLSFLEVGEDLVTTSWDILSGAAKPSESVLLFDDNGADAGLTVAAFIAGSGSRLEIVTPERSLAPEVGGTNYPAYFKTLSERNATISLNLRLEKVARSGNRLSATLFNEYDKSRRERLVDQVVVEHGTLPLEDLYFALKPGSRNLGEVDHGALIANRPQDLVRNPDGGYALYRIGDAVASRNIHAAIYDALRLAKDL